MSNQSISLESSLNSSKESSPNFSLNARRKIIHSRSQSHFISPKNFVNQEQQKDTRKQVTSSGNNNHYNIFTPAVTQTPTVRLIALLTRFSL